MFWKQVAHSECSIHVAVIIIHIHIIIIIIDLSTLESMLWVLSYGDVNKVQGSRVPRPSWGPACRCALPIGCVFSFHSQHVVPSLAASPRLAPLRS